MKKIDPLQLQKFYEMLDEVEKTFPLDRANIKYVIETKQKSQFPSGDNMAIMSAAPKEVADQCDPLVPIVSITSAPNHLSEHAGILELKIMDSIKKPGGGVEFIAWLSVFPSGRMVFEMNGARLDSNGKNITIEPVRIQRDHKFFNDRKLIQTLRKAMVLAFTAKEAVSENAKMKVLDILMQPLPDNN